MARTSKNSPSSRLSDLKSAWQDVKQSPSLHAVLGLTVLFIGLLGFVASTSTLFTWTSDFSALELGFVQVLSQRDVVIQNTLGSIGAALGMVVTVRGFGIASLLLWTVVMAFGLRWGLGIEIRALRWARRSLLRALLITTGLALLPWNAGDAVVGDYGRVIATWSTHWLGLLGACLTWLVLALIHAVWVFKLRPQMLGQHLANRFGATDAINEVRDDEEAELIPDEGPLVVDLSGSEPIQSPPWNEPEEDLDLVIQSTVEAPQASPGLVKPSPSEMGPYDPRRDLSRYQTPPLQLLNDYGQSTAKVDQEELEANKERILETLRNYKIEISKIKATVGPTVTLYEIVPEAGVRISKIKSLEDDIALSLSALGIRIIAPIPGKGTIGIEVPNRHPQMVSMRSVLASERFQNSDMDLPLVLGKTISNEVFIVDLAKMPHLLMAGATCLCHRAPGGQPRSSVFGAGGAGHRRVDRRAVADQHGREHGRAADQGADLAADELRRHRHPGQLHRHRNPPADRLGESTDDEGATGMSCGFQWRLTWLAQRVGEVMPELQPTTGTKRMKGAVTICRSGQS